MQTAETSSSQNLNAVLRLQRQLRQIDRKIPSSDSSVEKWLETQRELLFKQQFEYDAQMNSQKNSIDVSFPALPQLPSSVLKNITDGSQLQLDRILSRSSHLYSHLKKRVQLEAQNFRSRLKQFNEDIYSQIDDQNRQFQHKVEDLKKQQYKTIKQLSEADDRIEDVCKKLARGADRIERDLLEQISFMNEQNYNLTERLEDAGRNIQQEIQKQREVTNKMFRQHYGRLENCIRTLIDNGSM